MKKIFFPALASILISAPLFSSNSVNAEIVKNDRTYYTFSDFIKIDEEVEAFKIAECGENYDYWCAEDAFYEKFYQADKKYQVYDAYHRGSLTFDSFNPAQNTAKILYRDKDDMFWFDPNSYELTELYLYWLDPTIDTEHTRPLNTYIDAIKDSIYDPEKVHVLFAGNKPADFEWLTINELSVLNLNPDAGYSKTQPIHFHAVSNGKSYGRFDLHKCLSSEDYEEGMECTRVYSDQDMSVFPIRLEIAITEPESLAEPEKSAEPETVLEPEILSEPETIAKSEFIAEPEPTIEPEIIKAPGLNLNQAPILALKPEVSKPEVSKPEVSKPDTLKPDFSEPETTISDEVPLPIANSALTSDEKPKTMRNNREIDFPWPLLILTIFASIFAIWLIIPTKKQKK